MSHFPRIHVVLLVALAAAASVGCDVEDGSDPLTIHRADQDRLAGAFTSDEAELSFEAWRVGESVDVTIAFDDGRVVTARLPETTVAVDGWPLAEAEHSDEARDALIDVGTGANVEALTELAHRLHDDCDDVANARSLADAVVDTSSVLSPSLELDGPGFRWGGFNLCNFAPSEGECDALFDACLEEASGLFSDADPMECARNHTACVSLAKACEPFVY